MQKRATDRFSQKGPEGVREREFLAGEITAIAAVMVVRNVVKSPLNAALPQHLCQIMDQLGRLGFRKHENLVLVEQQVSVFAKIESLLGPEMTETTVPLVDVNFYAHLDPVAKLAICCILYWSDPHFKVSDHPFTRPTAI